ncbi:MAG: cytochrome c oxidase cbb3-type subunit 2 [Akkermansiaceae bacterium]|jgi:cytochrome c oxidase cbb3-type subunit 2
MTFKAFIFGLLVSFGFPWLVAVVIPFSTMNSPEPIEYEEGAAVSGVYIPKRDGRVSEGSKIYGQEGCYQCHTQLIRPTYAGNDVFRDEWAGLRKTADNPDTRRETLATDFEGEEVAYIGQSRVGPDLSNLGRRLAHHLKGTGVSPEDWLFRHLYNPRDPNMVNYRIGTQDIPERSSCPSKRNLFEEVNVYGAGADVLPLQIEDGKGIRANDRARQLVSYLASLKKDTLGQPLPEALNYNPKAPVAE